MSTPDLERQLTAVLHRHADEAMNRTDTTSELLRFEEVAEGSTRRRRTTAIAAAAAAVIVALAGLAWAASDQDENRSDLGPAQDPEVIRAADRYDGEAVPPGRYDIEFEGAPPGSPVAQVDVVAGYRLYNGSVLWNDGDEAGSGGLLFWTVDEVAHDPCRADSTGRSFYDPGPTVRDLATALRGQRYRQGPAPRPVTFAGYDGLYLELRFTRDLPRLVTCEGGDLDAWRSTDSRFQYDADSIDRIWILDVDGERLVVNQTYSAAAAPEGEPTLDRMLKSVRIEDRTAD